ncbi:hypothetical protein [Hymenobacter norwichensis]|uniref:hypothetical protein n=1 Tax=Hymenobacter norwichensis TaxID=223903 RepID=UPI0003B7A42E|nr:hypothetical protein [Hymenobacter norwichensis]
MNHTDSVQLAQLLHQANPRRRPQFLINCQHLTCLQTQGVSYLVSQLLLTKHAGADILLYNVNAVLGSALRLLHLQQVFQVLPPII